LTLFQECDDNYNRWVIRTKDEAYLPECINPKVKFGGGNIKFLACFSWKGVGRIVFVDETMTGELYKKILDENLFLSVCEMGLKKSGIFFKTMTPSI